jgi:hypothetical protein
MLADDRTYSRDTTGDGSTVSGTLRQTTGATMTDLEAIAARLARVLHDEGLFHGPAASGYRDERVIHKAASYILADDPGLAAMVDIVARARNMSLDYPRLAVRCMTQDATAALALAKGTT